MLKMLRPMVHGFVILSPQEISLDKGRLREQWQSTLNYRILRRCFELLSEFERAAAYHLYHYS